MTMTALDAIRSGQCTAVCLIAGEVTCECRCGGAFHGALADAEITWTPPPVDRRQTCGDRPPAGPGTPRLPDGDWLPPELGGCDLPPGHAPIPARYEHHNGGDYGPSTWYEAVSEAAASLDCRVCDWSGRGPGPCRPDACPGRSRGAP